MTLKEIIKEIERTKKPSDKINVRIAELLDPDIDRFGISLPIYEFTKDPTPDEPFFKRTGKFRRDLCPNFTHSLDDAMKLIPKGFHYTIHSVGDGQHKIDANVFLQANPVGNYYDSTVNDDVAFLRGQEALALTLACLRAYDDL